MIASLVLTYMKPNLLACYLIFFLCSCASMEKTQDIKTGKTDPSQVQKDYKWFRVGYDSYHPEKSSINKLKESLPAYRIIIFGGTWCPDTQELLPSFYKTIDEAGYSRSNTTLYLIDHNFQSPERMEDTYHIKSIPTFIILKNDIEIGRIVENPKNSIEESLAEIAK